VRPANLWGFGFFFQRTSGVSKMLSLSPNSLFPYISPLSHSGESTRHRLPPTAAISKIPSSPLPPFSGASHAPLLPLLFVCTVIFGGPLVFPLMRLNHLPPIDHDQMVLFFATSVSYFPKFFMILQVLLPP